MSYHDELRAARRYLAQMLCNQGIELDEAEEQAKDIERNIKSKSWCNDDILISELYHEAYRYEDM